MGIKLFTYLVIFYRRLGTLVLYCIQDPSGVIGASLRSSLVTDLNGGRLQNCMVLLDNWQLLCISFHDL